MLSPTQDHLAAGGIRSFEKIHLIGTRIRDIPACSIVPQLTTLPFAPVFEIYKTNLKKVAHVSKLYYHTSLLYPKSCDGNVAPTAKVCMSAMLLLLLLLLILSLLLLKGKVIPVLN
jgi:hypothetical protein